MLSLFYGSLKLAQATLLGLIGPVINSTGQFFPNSNRGSSTRGQSKWAKFHLSVLPRLQGYFPCKIMKRLFISKRSNLQPRASHGSGDHIQYFHFLLLVIQISNGSTFLPVDIG